MARIQLPIAEGFYVSQSKPLLDKRIVNMYPTIPQADAASPRALFQTPGIKQFSDVTAGSSRGVLVFGDGTPYRVIGSSLFSFSSNGTATNRGSVTGIDDVSMSSNGINIAIQDPNGNSYFFTPSTGVLELNIDSVFLSFGQAKSVTFKDGFYVYNTDSIFFSGSAKTVNDGKTFRATDFLDAEISPDKLIKVHNNHNQLYVFGENTTEPFETFATSGFPFRRINGASMQKGCIAPNTVVDFDNGFLFMGGDVNERPAIWKGLGSSFVKISTSSIDQMIHSATPNQIEDARMWVYAENGGYFAVLSIANNTFVYDATTSKLAGTPQWHERQSGVGNGDEFFVWRAIHGAESFGRILVGDDRSGLVGELDDDTFTEYGNTIERIISTKPFIERGESIFSKEVSLFVQVGEGNSESPSPQIRMDYSDNGGRSYSSEISRSLGKVGEYQINVRWSRLGRISNSRLFRWKVTDPVRFNVYALFANAEITNSG